MNKEELLRLIREKGMLVEKEIFEILNAFNNLTLAGDFLDSLVQISRQKMITSDSLSSNVGYVREFVSHLPGETKDSVEKVFVRLGIGLEVKKQTVSNVSSETTMGLDNPGGHMGDEKELENKEKRKLKEKGENYEVVIFNSNSAGKISVGDFVGHFRARYQQIQNMFLNRQGLHNLTAINKISGNRQFLTIIGMVTEKRKTKNGNLIVVFEDLTGRVSTLVKADNESFPKALELQMDDVVAAKVSGNSDLLFVQDIIFPDSFREKTRFESDVNIAFVSDVHVGSKKHLGKQFEEFISWLNSDDEVARKIRYVFFVGDNIDGVGVFPGQENHLALKGLEEQYSALASYLRKVPERVTMFMCPGQHDSVRVAEPQPPIDSYYGRELHEIPNLVLVSNPALVRLYDERGEGVDEKDRKAERNEFRVLMYHGASIHTFINEIDELRVMKAHKNPAKAVRHMLKRRHLAPMYGVAPSVVYVPNSEKDPLVISEVPDILCTGEVHRSDIENYNGSIIITGSCWQSQTDFEEKVGNIPDPCKVPVFNLKRRQMKILDFT